MKKKIWISIIFLILVLIIAFNIFKFYSEENSKAQDNYSEEIESSQTGKTVEEIKKEIGASADENIYEVQKEYDGREILTIKPDVQYKTVLAGILKNEKPTEQDVNRLNLSKFHQGIWISETSREQFLKILKKCNIQNFEIDTDGYLYKKEESTNEYSLKLDELIKSDKLTIIDIKGICYTRDEMTGEIVEYPFKDMDLYQVSENFETEGSKIIVITTNDVNEMDILKSICD